jgi:hypothetical protein
MKSLLACATALLTLEAFAGILPPEDKVLTLQPDADYSEIELQDYQQKLSEWDDFLKNMDDGGAVNLNIYSQFHRKSKKF